jgi:CDP-glucose 4,6-dehydratase
MGKWQCPLESMGIALTTQLFSSAQSVMPDPDFWRNKRVFLTGHTGFKGGWLTLWLSLLGAKITGYSLPPITNPNFYSLVDLERHLKQSLMGDVSDYKSLADIIAKANPEIILHLAAQPLVRRSYSDPLETYRTNVMGTVNLLQASRICKNLQAIIVVTSDKCYENRSWDWGYRETDTLGGYDPYSSSKACQELAVSAFRRSFFTDIGVVVATVRAGNVIGGGDWSEDRLIPDAIRAHTDNRSLTIRNPRATRPWQHVLEPLSGYLVLAERLCLDPELAGGWNFGPSDSSVRSVEEVLSLLSSHLPGGLNWRTDTAVQPHEAKLLKLDCSKALAALGWAPIWRLEQALALTCDWYISQRTAENIKEVCFSQIASYSSAQAIQRIN